MHTSEYRELLSIIVIMGKVFQTITRQVLPYFSTNVMLTAECVLLRDMSRPDSRNSL